MKNKTQEWGIHWFRRDLRVTGNRALLENMKRHQGRTVGIFCFDSKFLSREDFSYNRFAFFLKTIDELRKDLAAVGGDLLVVDALPLDAFDRILSFCDVKPSLISWGRDYEPYARARDAKVAEFLAKEKIESVTHRDHLLFEPFEISKNSGLQSEEGNLQDYYKVYSPWSKKWFAAMKSEEGQKRIAEIARPHRLAEDAFALSWREVFYDSKGRKAPLQDAFEHFQRENNKHVKIEIPAAGLAEGMKEVRRFKSKLDKYKADRDYPSLDATSKISMFMKNGSLTIAHVLHELKLTDSVFGADSGATKFVLELAWREFYYAILYHWPKVETEAFQEKYRKVKWSENKAHFDAWIAGRTGYPIVDAAMRELAQTGWITNRVRIVVASFLSKDLLINWQWGEKHFMHLLLDGDLAPNNGNWQWAASTGSDPNPYFRVLSPWSQSKRFDPKGDYIRRFVPELRDAPAKMLHDPDADLSEWKYPKQIIDHSIQREKAIAMFAGR